MINEKVSKKYPEVGSVIGNILSSDKVKYHFWGIYQNAFRPYLAFPKFYGFKMQFRLIWTATLLIFIVGGKARISRSPQKEMKMLEVNQIHANTSSVNMDEYWPFPKAISEVDPYVFDLEQRLLSIKKGG